MRRGYMLFNLVIMMICSSFIIVAQESSQIEFTEEERRFIEQHPTIKIGIDPGFMPFEYLDENGNYTGITADYLELLSERLGVEFQIVQGLTWPEAYEAAKNKEIDLLPAISKTIEREEYFLFSKEYYNFKRVMVTQSDNQDLQDIDDISGRTVAVQRNSSHHSYLMNRPEVNLSLYDSVEVALTSVANGNEEIYLGNLATTNYLIRSTGLTNLRYIAFESEKPLGLHVAVRDDWPELLSIVNKGLNTIREEEQLAIHKRWIGVTSEVDYGPFLRIIFAVALLAIVSLSVSSYWIIRLRKEVKKREEIQRELIKASHVKSSFMARMSHEIRTPLNAIIGLSYIMKNKQATTTQLIHLDRITQAANTMLGIVNDLLDFSKIEAGKIEIEHVSFNIETVIQNVLSIISYKLQDSNVELQVNKSPELPNWFIGDGKRIEQILLNLLNNAVKFTESGHIYLSVEVKKSEENSIYQICFYIEDSGIGMTEEQLQHLFQPFTQADASINRRFGGTGLGLSIVKNLVEIMDGTVEAESQEGKGSIFRIELPLMLDEEREKTYREKIIKTNLSNLHTLIISSDTHLNDIIASYLKSFSMNYQKMESLEDAKLWIEHKNVYDLIILDYDIQSEDVFDFVLSIKNDGKVTKLPKIILLLPVMREDLFSQIETYGVDIGIGKPLIPSVLFNGIIDLYGQNYEKDISKDLNSTEYKTQTILLVEDNQTNQLIAKSLLEEAGYMLIIGNNGKEGIELYKKHQEKIDIVLMDLHMPILNGYDSAKAIRHISQDVPIVAMTADMIEGVKEKCEDHGMHHFIGKPFEPEKLAETIYNIIISNKMKRENEKKATKPNDLLNAEQGIQQFGGNKDLYLQVIQMFYEENKEFVEEFDKVLVTKQYKEGRDVIHKIKGSLGNLACNELFHIAKNLQKAFETEDEKSIEDLANDFSPKMARLMVEIEEML